MGLDSIASARSARATAAWWIGMPPTGTSATVTAGKMRSACVARTVRSTTAIASPRSAATPAAPSPKARSDAGESTGRRITLDRAEPSTSGRPAITGRNMLDTRAWCRKTSRPPVQAERSMPGTGNDGTRRNRTRPHCMTSPGRTPTTARTGSSFNNVPLLLPRSRNHHWPRANRSSA